MKFELIKDAKKLILCFLGYSFLPSSLAHLELGEYGLGVFYDYSDVSFDLEKINFFAYGDSLANFIFKKELFFSWLIFRRKSKKRFVFFATKQLKLA